MVRCWVIGWEGVCRCWGEAGGGGEARWGGEYGGVGGQWGGGWQKVGGCYNGTGGLAPVLGPDKYTSVLSIKFSVVRTRDQPIYARSRELFY